ncbi:hypothetical protein HanPI659440_Chr03g0096021 [Helianthus annuus]|nr:hypothetical protein HanPI659440_Chr03g0096021 [Helianthus annuus]
MARSYGILFAITIFRQDFSFMFLSMVTALLLIKSLHWSAQKRVEYIETTPTVLMLSHYLIQARQASVSLFFSFDDMLMEGQWERKVVYTFYLELSDLLHLSMYLCFFLVNFVNYGVPLHLIRELYETFRNFKLRIADYIRYRIITSNMNNRFPDATPEELNKLVIVIVLVIIIIIIIISCPQRLKGTRQQRLKGIRQQRLKESVNRG